MRYHTAQNDGLVGLTQAERDLIAERIARVSAAKEQADGRELLPFEIAVALDPAAAGAGKRRCARCHSDLPLTVEYFYSQGGGRLRSECKTCTCRDVLKRRAQQFRTNSPRDLERSREYQRRRREADKAAGIKRPQTAKLKLQKERSKNRVLLRTATDPARIEHLKARIANLTHEIERLDREAER